MVRLHTSPIGWIEGEYDVVTDAPNGKAPRQPNNVLTECRTALRLSHEKLAYLVREKARDRGIQIGTLDSVTRHIKRIEAGHVRDPSMVYKSLLCAVLHKTEAFLFGVVSLEVGLCGSMSANTFCLRNHIIPAFVGASSAQGAIDNLGMQAAPTSPTRCYHCTLIITEHLNQATDAITELRGLA